ncbi:MULTISPECIES: hypothetical protein [unclassified Pseudomonas]|uniref:hypothetical protein n=1 Tax=unclassified Pseudomonas TaxID=196821 RepID=UPI0030D8D18A
MLKINKQPILPPQLQWKHADEPELLSWAIRARNYNTVIANCMFLFMAIIILAATFFMYSVYEDMDQPWRIASCVFFFSFILFTISCMTHQKMNFAYRFTQSGLECCEWKNIPEWTLTFLKWFTGITAITFIILATIDPTFLIGALIGPGGMGLIYLSMANSKSYREMHTQYHHLIYEWKDFTQLAIATNREVVDLKFTHYNQRLGKIISYSINIFCEPKQKEKIANFIKPYLSPDIPFIRAKVNVPMSTV